MKYKEEELDEMYEEFRHLKDYGLMCKLKEHPRMTQLVLEITERCNAKCAHCNINCDDKLKEPEIEAEYLKKVIKQVAERYGPRGICVGFTGGEALLRKDFYELAAFSRDCGFGNVLTTNGTLLSKKVIDKLHDVNVRAIWISIDGLAKTHEEFRRLPGVYPKILENLKIIADRDDMLCGVTTVVSKKNINELEDLYKQFLDIGVQSWRVFAVDPEGRAKENDDIILGKEELETMYNFVERVQNENKMDVFIACGHFLGFKYEKKVRRKFSYGCTSGTEIATILANGDIIGCANAPRIPKLIEGNIRTDDFIDAWENKFKVYRDLNARKNKKCAACKYWKYCLGDALHTYDFDEDRPTYCLKNILKF